MADLEAILSETIAGLHPGVAPPGLSIACAIAGLPAATASRGFASLELGTAFDTSTRGAIGSVSKQMTAAAVAVLERSGNLHRGDRVGSYLSEIAGVESTLWDLLQHRSGFPREDPRSVFQSIAPAQRLSNAFAGSRMDSTKQFAYNNLNYMALGLIVERRAGIPFNDFLREVVLAPEIDVDLQHGSNCGRDAVGYTGIPTKYREAHAWHESALWAVGGLRGSALGLVEWGRRAWKSLGYDDARVFIAEELDGLEGPPYSGGWLLDMLAGERVLYHDGTVAGFRAGLLHVVDAEVYVGVVTNADDLVAAYVTSPVDVARRVASLMLGVPPPPALRTPSMQGVIVAKVKDALIRRYIATLGTQD
jgi:CubicO group peptidase (beta-lactamase class C family)